MAMEIASTPLTGGNPLASPAAKKWAMFTFVMTYVGYAMNHFSRKCYSSTKTLIRDSIGLDAIALSQMDTAFMFMYAIGSIFSGKLGDTFNPAKVEAWGLIWSFVCLLVLLIGVWTSMAPSVAHGVFLVTWLVFGFAQSTGGPCGTTIVGAWFPDKKSRGSLFGFWTTHQYIGNIIAAVVTAIILGQGVTWTWAIIIPAVLNLIDGVAFFSVPATPKEVGIGVDASKPDAAPGSAIGFLDALRIPGVVSYAVAFGGFKLTNYILFFWLPYFLSTNFSPEATQLISTMYDVGMMPGGIIVGYISDLYGGRRACVIATFMAILIPLLFVFAEYSEVMPATVVIIGLLLCGILIGGPNNIITSAVSADLASDPSIGGNTRSLGTVTGIINGSGSIVAAFGLLAVGPLQVHYGWSSVWYLMIGCTLMGTLIMSPTVYKELYHHGAPAAPAPAPTQPRGYQAVRQEDSKA